MFEKNTRLRVWVEGDKGWDSEEPNPDVKVARVETLNTKRLVSDTRGETGKMLSLTFGLLLVMYSVYAMLANNQAMLDSGFDLVRLGLTASAAWTFGHKGASEPHERT